MRAQSQPTQLDLPKRIALFVQACDAIDHAPEPRAFDPSLELANVLTAESVQYLSPEQNGAGAWQVGPASAVYTLGVALYKLLVGGFPHDTIALEKARTMGMIDWFYDDGPLSLSARLDLMRDDGDRAAAELGLTRNELASAVNGELARIVMKALSKDPTKRQTSPEELARELRHYLDSSGESETTSPLRDRLIRPLKRLFETTGEAVHVRRSTGCEQSLDTRAIQDRLEPR